MLSRSLQAARLKAVAQQPAHPRSLYQVRSLHSSLPAPAGVFIRGASGSDSSRRTTSAIGIGRQSSRTEEEAQSGPRNTVDATTSKSGSLGGGGINVNRSSAQRRGGSPFAALRAEAGDKPASQGAINSFQARRDAISSVDPPSAASTQAEAIRSTVPKPQGQVSAQATPTSSHQAATPAPRRRGYNLPGVSGAEASSSRTSRATEEPRATNSYEARRNAMRGANEPGSSGTIGDWGQLSDRIRSARESEESQAQSESLYSSARLAGTPSSRQSPRSISGWSTSIALVPAGEQLGRRYDFSASSEARRFVQRVYESLPDEGEWAGSITLFKDASTSGESVSILIGGRTDSGSCRQSDVALAEQIELLHRHEHGHAGRLVKGATAEAGSRAFERGQARDDSATLNVLGTHRVSASASVEESVPVPNLPHAGKGTGPEQTRESRLQSKSTEGATSAKEENESGYSESLGNVHNRKGAESETLTAQSLSTTKSVASAPIEDSVPVPNLPNAGVSTESNGAQRTAASETPTEDALSSRIVDGADPIEEAVPVPNLPNAGVSTGLSSENDHASRRSMGDTPTTDAISTSTSPVPSPIQESVPVPNLPHARGDADAASPPQDERANADTSDGTASMVVEERSAPSSSSESKAFAPGQAETSQSATARAMSTSETLSDADDPVEDHVPVPSVHAEEKAKSGGE